MVLRDVVSLMPKEQEIVVFQGFIIKYIGARETCNDEDLLDSTVKSIESNGTNITFKLI